MRVYTFGRGDVSMETTVDNKIVNVIIKELKVRQLIGQEILEQNTINPVLLQFKTIESLDMMINELSEAKKEVLNDSRQN